MSEFILKEGNGSIFRNKKKDSEKQPDFRGEIKINNIVYEFGVWEKRSDKGTVWLSIGGARPKQDKGEQPAERFGGSTITPKPEKPALDNFEDNIPW